jgi:hypothetical protein
LRLRKTGSRPAWLDLDLDLFETLMRIHGGFTPSREELQGAWLNLRIFKEQLASMGSSSLLLSRDDDQFFNIERMGREAVIKAEEVGR